MGKKGTKWGCPYRNRSRSREYQKSGTPIRRMSPNRRSAPPVASRLFRGRGSAEDRRENYTIQDPKRRKSASSSIKIPIWTAQASGDVAKHADTMTSDRVPSEKQAPQASERQREQGQRQDETARGAGFKIEDARSKRDRVKAEVDDQGHVTTLKYLAGHDSR